MQMPSQNPDTLFEELLQDLPPEIEEVAREFKAFTRARKIKTVNQLLRAVLLYSGLDKTLRETAANLTLTVEQITDTSVAERLIACRVWIKAILPKMLNLPPISERLNLESNMRFLVIDGSQIQGPGAKGTNYRLHICMDLITLEFVEIIITDKHRAESLSNFSLGKADIAIADRAYAYANKIIEAVNKGANVILRVSSNNLPIYRLNGQPLDLMEELKRQAYETIISFPVLLKSSDGNTELKGWLTAYRLTEEQANEARRKARRRSQKRGETPKEKVLFMAGWILVFSSLGPEHFSAEMIMELYRLRWQVEVAIKRWKSLLDVGELRAREGSPLAEIWLYGKMLYVLMIERRTRRKMGDHWGWLDHEREATWWRAWKIIKDEIDPIITCAQFWFQQAWQKCLQVLKERSRRRKLQAIPKAILDVSKSFLLNLNQSLKVAA